MSIFEVKGMQVASAHAEAMCLRFSESLYLSVLYSGISIYLA
jgi:hypothetical protein